MICLAGCCHADDALGCVLCECLGACFKRGAGGGDIVHEQDGFFSNFVWIFEAKRVCEVGEAFGAGERLLGLGRANALEHMRFEVPGVCCRHCAPNKFGLVEAALLQAPPVQGNWDDNDV